MPKGENFNEVNVPTAEQLRQNQIELIEQLQTANAIKNTILDTAIQLGVDSLKKFIPSEEFIGKVAHKTIDHAQGYIKEAAKEATQFKAGPETIISAEQARFLDAMHSDKKGNSIAVNINAGTSMPEAQLHPQLIDRSTDSFQNTIIQEKSQKHESSNLYGSPSYSAVELRQQQLNLKSQLEMANGAKNSVLDAAVDYGFSKVKKFIPNEKLYGKIALQNLKKLQDGIIKSAKTVTQFEAGPELIISEEQARLLDVMHSTNPGPQKVSIDISGVGVPLNKPVITDKKYPPQVHRLTQNLQRLGLNKEEINRVVNNTLQNKELNIAAIQHSTEQVVSWLAQEKEQRTKQQEFQNITQFMDFTQQLGTFTQCKALQDAATAAKAIYVGYQAVSQLSNLAAGASMGLALGPVGMLGGAALGLCSLFMNSGPSASELIMKQLQGLSNQVAQLHKSMGEHFKQVFKNQEMIYQTIVKSFSHLSLLVSGLRIEMRNSLTHIQSSLDFLTKYIQINFEQITVQSFEDICCNVDNWLRGNSYGKPTKEIPKLCNNLSNWLIRHSSAEQLNGISLWRAWHAKPDNRIIKSFFELSPDVTILNSFIGFLASYAISQRQKVPTQNRRSSLPKGINYLPIEKVPTIQDMNGHILYNPLALENQLQLNNLEHTTSIPFEVGELPNALLWYKAVDKYLALKESLLGSDIDNDPQGLQLATIINIGNNTLRFFEFLENDLTFWKNTLALYNKYVEEIQLCIKKLAANHFENQFERDIAEEKLYPPIKLNESFGSITQIFGEAPIKPKINIFTNTFCNSVNGQFEDRVPLQFNDTFTFTNPIIEHRHLRRPIILSTTIVKEIILNESHNFIKRHFQFFNVDSTDVKNKKLIQYTYPTHLNNPEYFAFKKRPIPELFLLAEYLRLGQFNIQQKSFEALEIIRYSSTSLRILKFKLTLNITFTLRSTNTTFNVTEISYTNKTPNTGTYINNGIDFYINSFIQAKWTNKDNFDYELKCVATQDDIRNITNHIDRIFLEQRKIIANSLLTSNVQNNHQQEIIEKYKEALINLDTTVYFMKINALLIGKDINQPCYKNLSTSDKINSDLRNYLNIEITNNEHMHERFIPSLMPNYVSKKLSSKPLDNLPSLHPRRLIESALLRLMTYQKIKLFTSAISIEDEDISTTNLYFKKTNASLSSTASTSESNVSQQHLYNIYANQYPVDNQMEQFARQIVGTELYRDIIGGLEINYLRNNYLRSRFSFIQSDQRQIILIYELFIRNIPCRLNQVTLANGTINVLTTDNSIIILSELESTSNGLIGLQRQLRNILLAYKDQLKPIYMSLNRGGIHYTTLVVVPEINNRVTYRYVDPFYSNNGGWVPPSNNNSVIDELTALATCMDQIFTGGVQVINTRYIAQQDLSMHNNECALHNIFNTLLMVLQGPAADISQTRRLLNDIPGNNSCNNGSIDAHDAERSLRPKYATLFTEIIKQQELLNTTATTNNLIFSFHDITAQTVHLAGSFNNWLDASEGQIRENHDRWSMTKNNEGLWTITVQLEPGRYEYKFVINNGQRWEADPTREHSNQGNINQNSVITIETPTTNNANSANEQNISQYQKFTLFGNKKQKSPTAAAGDNASCVGGHKEQVLSPQHKA